VSPPRSGGSARICWISQYPVFSRHREVAQKHVAALPQQRCERLFGGIDRGDLGATLREDVSHDLEHVGRVVDNQHARHRDESPY
jgi:hypothetical protein